MKFGLILPTNLPQASAEAIRQAALLAEELGYDSLWTTDHVMISRTAQAPYHSIFEALSTLAWLAGLTTKAKLGVSVLVFCLVRLLPGDIATVLGGPEVMELREVPDPVPGDGEVLVEVEAAGINFRDVYERLEDDHGIAVLLHRLSIFALMHGEPDRARALAERSLELHRRKANDKGAVQPLALLGAIALQAGDRPQGLALLEESAELAGRIGWRWWRAGTLSALADVALAEERAGDARELLRESLDLGLQISDRVGLSWYLRQFALTLGLEARTAEAGRIWGAVEAANAFVPGGPWPRDADELEHRMLAIADTDFERAREQGRSLTLEAMAAELSAL